MPEVPGLPMTKFLESATRVFPFRVTDPVPEVKAPVASISTSPMKVESPFAVVNVPAPALIKKFLAAAIVRSPFAETAPVPVLKVESVPPASSFCVIEP
jgi:hypothetical protein